MDGFYFTIFFVLVFAGFDPAIGNITAKDPFYPCSSIDDLGSVSVTCNNVSLAQVKTAFQNSKIYYIYSLYLKPMVSDKKIPANIIGNHSIELITLTCPIRNSNPLLVDPAAFRLTSSDTYGISIYNCDLQYVDWSFLKDFSNLMTFSIQTSSNLHKSFYTLPTATLTSLYTFKLKSVMGLNGFNSTSLKFPAPPPYGLITFSVKYCYDVGHEALGNLMAKWVTPTSIDTLRTIYLIGNSLTRFPPEINKYNQVNTAEFWANRPPLKIQSGSFNFKAPVDYLAIDNANVVSISPGAFQGNFQDALVYIGQNSLTTFDSGVFLTMLQQMRSSNGYLDTNGNPFDCTVKNQCNLAWLIRDNPSLLDSAWEARCSNGTYFYDLKANSLRRPNGTKCP